MTPPTLATIPKLTPKNDASPSHAGAGNPVLAVANRFVPAGRDLYEGRELLRRVDTKFVAMAPVASRVLEQIVDDYAALTVPSGNVASYHSIYFDTADRVCFHDHRRGRRIRHKIRIRHYPDRQLSFLEVKTKRNDQVTDKFRVELPYGVEALGPGELAFLRSRIDLPVEALQPVMHIDFHRVSLVGITTNERVTLDIGLSAQEINGKTWSLDRLVVFEIKQSPFSPRTPIMRAIQDAGLREQSLSKYTVATAMLNPDLHCNRLLPALRALERKAS